MKTKKNIIFVYSTNITTMYKYTKHFKKWKGWGLQWIFLSDEWIIESEFIWFKTLWTDSQKLIKLTNTKASKIIVFSNILMPRPLENYNMILYNILYSYIF